MEDSVQRAASLPTRRAIAVASLLVAALAADGCNFAASSRRAERLQEQRTRLAAEEKEAAKCVTSLAAKNPRRDAEQDASRGDSTPIGESFTPHDPPDTNTLYNEACEHGYDGPYHATGKWFTYTHNGFSFFARPKGYYQCSGKAREYVRNYNRRMRELAPAEVQRFCLKQKLSQSERRWAASRAVLGAEERTEILNGRSYNTKVAWMIDTTFGPVLITRSYLRARDILRQLRSRRPSCVSATKHSPAFAFQRHQSGLSRPRDKRRTISCATPKKN